VSTCSSMSLNGLIRKSKVHSGERPPPRSHHGIPLRALLCLLPHPSGSRYSTVRGTTGWRRRVDITWFTAQGIWTRTTPSPSIPAAVLGDPALQQARRSREGRPPEGLRRTGQDRTADQQAASRPIDTGDTVHPRPLRRDSPHVSSLRDAFRGCAGDELHSTALRSYIYTARGPIS